MSEFETIGLEPRTGKLVTALAQWLIVATAGERAWRRDARKWDLTTIAIAQLASGPDGLPAYRRGTDL